MELNRVYQMDCFEGLKQLPDNSVDLILTDPPYNVLSMDWDQAIIDWQELAKELYRVLRYNGTVYIFGQFPMICDVYNAFSKHFRFKQDLVWYKNNGFNLASTIYSKHHENLLFFVKGPEQVLKQFGEYLKEQRTLLCLSLRQIGELCGEKWYHRGGHMYFETGLASPTKQQYEKLKEVLQLDNRFDCIFDRPTFNFEDIKIKGEPYTYKSMPKKFMGKHTAWKEATYQNDGKRNPKSVLEYSVVSGGKEYVGHPTQKPVEMLKYLLTASSREGEIILDPFMGSGSTAVACQQLGRQFIGFEKKEEYVKIAESRLVQKALVTM